MSGLRGQRAWGRVVVAALLLGLTGRAQDDRLTLATPRSVALEAGASRSLSFEAPANGFVRLAIDRDSPGIRVRVLDPAGAVLDVGVRVRAQPSQHLFFLTPAAGVYRIEFSLDPGAALKRTATARLLEARAATATDTPRIAADNLASEAAALQSQNAAERRLAVDKLEQSLPLWREAGDVRGEADAHNRVGSIYYQLGDFKASLAAHERALPLFERVGDVTLLAESLGNQAVALQNLGQADRAVDLYARILEMQRTSGNRRGEAYALHNLGAALYRLGRYQDALARYEEALAAKRAIGVNTAGITVGNMGTTRTRLGEHRAALADHQTALELRRAAKDRRGEAYELQNLGSTYLVLDEWPAALEHLRAADPLFEALGDARGQGSTLHNLGAAYEAMGDDERALAYFDRALAIRRPAGDPATTSTTLMRMGLIAERRGDLPKARVLLTESLSLKQAGKDRYGEAYVRTALAQLELASGDHATALDHARAGVDISRALQDLSGLASALNRLAQIQTVRAAHDDAVAALREAIGLQSRVQTSRTEADSRYLLARTELVRGNLDTARNEAIRALEIVEGLRPRASGGQLRSAFVASRQGYYGLAIDILMQLDARAPAGGHALRALEISERARATRLLDTLAEARVDIREGVDTALLAREQQLAADIEARETVRARLVAENAAPEVVSGVAASIARTVAELADVRTRIRATSPRYASLVSAPARSASEIQQTLLGKDTMLVEFWLGDERSYLWAVSSSGVRTAALPPRKAIEAAVREFHTLLGARQMPVSGESLVSARSRIARADAASIETAKKLGAMLLSPLAGARESRWVIVADGALEYLPFGALPDPSAGAAAAPLIVTRQLVSAPSATAVAAMRAERTSRVRATKSVAVVADPVFSADDVRVRARADGAGTSAQSRSNQHDPESPLAVVLRSGGDVGLASLPRLAFSRD